ncbi:BufA1 family periplasmic bufferin-type metallophore [Parachitinimonas caeni]|uniref:DUF2282 domain-containing protein n=1 Tax=Parachitinimonas caeni TaxID=3031301 RepID=A0ABT7E1U6_9NEIS|nr:DUF2282 domain-containing protein [Parachitinimonas caeni]MDK2126286.1 DUF2282 domain-containing protein [Parachitinimonas caeni]
MSKQTTLISTAIAGVLALGVATAAQAEEAKEKCYGVSKAGQNDCASKDGGHSCAGQSKKDMDKNEWKYVAKGTCEKMKGSLKPGGQ